MYAKQYEITLPADYDMEILRKRVADAAPMLDDRAGLGLKAYVIRERGVAGSPVNQYAPFYLWHDTGAMAHFLFGGGGFERIIRSFGRPAVLHWTGLAQVAGPAQHAAPKAASRRQTEVPPYADEDGLGLSAAISREIDTLAEYAGREGVHTAALAIDPQHWRLVRFVLWAETVPPDEETTERYEVLHVSAPEPEQLPTGRAW